MCVCVCVATMCQDSKAAYKDIGLLSLPLGLRYNFQMLHLAAAKT